MQQALRLCQQVHSQSQVHCGGDEEVDASMRAARLGARQHRAQAARFPARRLVRHQQERLGLAGHRWCVPREAKVREVPNMLERCLPGVGSWVSAQDDQPWCLEEQCAGGGES